MFTHRVRISSFPSVNLHNGSFKVSIGSDSVLEFVSCKCAKGCLNNRCSCVKATLSCTDLCKCNGCKNAVRNTDEAEDTDTYDSEGSSSCSDDSEDEWN